ncbi:MAG: type II secretion system F family protein [bacterium]|nr:type II secretion system F family protein [bacterium]
MPQTQFQYRYRARNKNGEIITGLVESQSLEAAQHILNDHGLSVLSLETPKTLSEILHLGGVKVRQRAFFARQLATMVNAGLPLPQVLSLLARSERNPLLKQTIITIQDDIETGYSFSTALAKHPKLFSRVFVNAIRSGEATGKLEVVLAQLADTLERDSAATNRLRSVMLYPVFVMITMIVVGIIMMVRVVPVLVSIFGEAQAQLPFATRALIGVSDFVRGFWWLLILVAVGGFIGARVYGQTERGKLTYDTLKLRVYIIRDVTKVFFMARFCRTLGMLISAGVPLLEAIQITSDAMDNLVYKKMLEKVSIQVERGVALSLALSKSNLFPPLVSQMILVGEQTGELDKVLTKLSNSYEDDYDTLVKGTATLLEPLVIVLLGIGVAFMVFAILIPIYQISLIQ